LNNTMNGTWMLLSLILFINGLSLTCSDDKEDADIQAALLRRVRAAPRVKRIIGGQTFNDGEWPWLVNLKGEIPSSSWLWIVTSYTNYYCGGSLISDQWVMTAAHCFRAPGAPSSINSPKNWHIKAGDVKRKVSGFVDAIKQFWYSITNQKTADWYYTLASKIIVHPEYDAKDKFKNDIALIKLEKKLPVAPADPSIAPVTFPYNVSADWPPAGANCSMQGWGCSVEGGPLQDYAKAVTLPIVDDASCSAIYGYMGPTRICAGFNLAGKGICQGDSGGPLVCRNGQYWTQAGIASFANGDKSSNWPGAFTRVSKYLDWINAVVASN